MNIISKVFACLLILTLSQQTLSAQTCPSIDAQVGTGASTTICSGQCANLTATLVPVLATTSYSVGSITYSPYPFSGGTAAIGNIDDLWSSAINIGFNFCYFGNTFNQVLIGSNGEITFDVSVANSAENFATTTVLPNLTEHVGNSICVAYRDIDPSSGASSSVFTYTTGVAPCRKFVAYWSNVPLFQCNTPASTFQIVLHEGTNIIETYVQNSTACASWQSGRGLMGIQDATSTTAVAPSGRNVLTAWTATNEAWRYVPTGAPTYTVNWLGSDGFTASGLTAAPCPTATSTYTATMDVSDCTGAVTSFTSSVQVSVTPTPTAPIVATPTAICRGGSATLSASGATSYTWLPGGATTASITVTPTITTTYTLNRDNGGCVNTQTISLIVNANPTVTATRTPTVLCSGGTATLTASGASTYTWNPGALTGNTVVVSPTVTTQYTVTGTSALGCTSTRTVNLAVSTTPTVTATASSATACSGSSVTLTSSGASTYTWIPGSVTGATVVVTPTANTTYTVRGRNTAGCVGTNTVNVSVTPGITFTVSATPTVICRGGTSTLTATGVTSYTWLPGTLTGSSIAVSPTATTVYTVTGDNGGACTATKHVTVTVSVPNITATKTPTSVCAGNSATLTAAGGVAGSYTWAPVGVSGSPIVVTPTATTVYTVTGANALGCINTRTISLPVLANPTVNIAATSVSLCPGSSSTLTASGAVGYTWSPGSFTTTAIVVTPTVTSTYTVQGRNASRCVSAQTIDITVFPTVTVSPLASPGTICPGGTSTLTASGAITYTWNPGALTGSNVSVSPSVTSNYTVTGTDVNNCAGSSTVSVNVSTLNIVASSNPTILCSSNTATLTGTGAVSYTWNPGGLTTSSIVVTPTATTVYTVTGTDAFGCSATSTLNLSVGLTPTVMASASSSTICAGTSLTLSSSGASTYTWSPGALTGSVVTDTPVTSTTYTVTGENAAGCVATSTVFVFVNPAPVIDATPPAILCSGSSTTLTATGASTYTWSPGALTGGTITVSPLVTTVYTVVGTSSLNCAGTATVNLKVTATPTINITASPSVVCTGGSSTLTASGANTYTWSPGGATGATTVVTPTTNTTYTVTGDNGFGCISNQTIALSVTSGPTVTASSSPSIICPGNSSTLTATGAISYTWNPGALTGSNVAVSPTTSTTYTVDADDGIGCIVSTTVDVAVSTLPSVSITTSSTFVCAPGSVTLTASGAVNYTWMPGGATTPVITDSPTVTTTYTVDGVDALGCTNTQTITITENTPVINVVSSPTAICTGATATLTANGATSYTWAPLGATGATITDAPASTTTYTVTGDNGSCTGSQTISLVVNSNPTITASASSATICAGSSTTLTASGASTYTWNPGALTGSNVAVSPTISTTYTVDGDNGLGCISTTTVDVFINPAPSISIVATPSILCAPGSVTLTASGANTYTWIPSATTGTTFTDNPSVTTTYSVIGEDVLGCTTTQTLTLSVGIPTITIASPTAICIGSTATLTAGGALTYTWAPLGVTGTSITDSPTVTTTYTVTGDNGGCIGTETITLVVNNYPVITPSVSSATVCAGSSTTLTASGASTYTWNPGALTGTNVVVSPTVSTTYTVDGDNGTGCVASLTIDVSVNPAPSLSIAATPSILCMPGPLTLTASGANTYTWIPSATAGATFTDSPTVTTTYSVIGEDVLGCTATQTITVSVGNPTVTLTSTSGTICSGNTTTLSAGGALTYTWAPLGVSGAIITDSPTVTTTYTVTGDNGGCIGTETITVVVNATPSLSVTTSSGTICSGSSATLTASGAATYTWNPGILTGTNVVVTPTATTTYTLDGDNGTGCIGTTTLMVTVNALPSVSVASTSTVLCGSGSVTLTASGANTYTWAPSGAVGANITDTPTITTTYTVNGEDVSGCINTSTLTVSVGSLPTLTLATIPSTICAGSAASLNASGASTYTWNPGGFTGSSIIDAPSVTTTYTVTGDNGTGCTNTETVTLTVVSGAPALTVTASPTLVCSGLSSTLTASGATSYTWFPVGSTTASTVVTPTTATTYSLLADNGLCVSTATILVDIAPLPANVTATTNGTITCSTSTVDLFGNSTSTGVNYSWNGPASYTSSVQNPTGITTDGDYTLTVTDPASGCFVTTTVSVVSNTTIPVVGVASPAPMLGCNPTVTLSVITTSTLMSWSGPGGFTSTATTPTTSVAGDYTVTVTDPVNGCQNTVVITIGTSTVLPVFTATAMPPTCSGTLANTDGMIMISGFSGTDTYDMSQAATYTGTATYGTALPIPLGGTLVSSLANPASATPYTIRVFSSNGCYKDTTVTLTVTNCNPTPVTVLGMTKAVSTPTLVNGNAYNVTYTIVATNASTVNIDNFSITDNLSATFPAPGSFSVISTPSITSLNSSLTVNPGFDGLLQTNLMIPGSSTLTAGKVDTLVFTVQILPNGFFGPFNNSAVGTGTDNLGAAVSDSSNAGFAWDPDGNGDPTDNNIPTVLNLTPNSVIGIAKAGSVSEVLDDKTIDVTFVFTVKNLGNDTIKNVQVLDTLLISAPAQFMVKSGPSTTSLSANTNYNGLSDIRLLDGLGKLAPGSVETITVVINIKPEGVKTITNTAIAVGFSQTGAVVRDTSMNGYDPDPNANGYAGDSGESEPTILDLPDVELFVPEVFTPDGDGKNDLFVIKGISGRTVKLVVYNRWGSVVYKNDAYDNTWDGVANVKTMVIGNSKLPQGTYYYIVEFEDGQDDPIKGYVVLQY